MSLLSICAAAANNVGVAPPSAIIGNSDPAAARLLQLARRAGHSLAKRANWTSLIVEHVFYADGGSDYALPSDFRSLIDNTLWDRSRYWAMRGPMTPQQWQFYKSSTIGNASIQRRWRIRVPTGAAVGAGTVFSINPAISSTDTSSQFVFEYVSSNWCRSATTFSIDELIPVAGGTGFGIGDQFSIAGGTGTAATGVVTALGGSGVASAEVVTAGSYTVLPSSPAGMTATTGAGSGATFLINSTTSPGASQSDWVADTDVGIVGEDLLELGIIWRLLARLGLAYAEEKDEYEREVDRAIARDGGATVLNLAPRGRGMLIGPWNVPESGFGGPSPFGLDISDLGGSDVL